MSFCLSFLPPLAEKRLVPLIGRRSARFITELVCFGAKEAAACVFAGTFLVLLVVSSYIRIPGVYRYDLLFVGALAIQVLLVAVRLETWREVGVLSLFHVLGMGLELFKTSPEVHSWIYPEPALFKVGTVPLYSGFMYAAIASYMMQAWRLLDLRLVGFPPAWQAVGLSVLVYANFFLNHFMPDQRWLLGALVIIAFRRCFVFFTVIDTERRMPLVLAFFLIGFFIWVAENIATFFGAWVYPHQGQQWAIVGTAKISSWALLVIVSFIIVAALKGKSRAAADAQA